jgi:hypothetical protein
MAGTHVLGNVPGRNLKSQSCEFGLDSLLTPEPVLSSHPLDEGLKVLRNRSSTVKELQTKVGRALLRLLK